MKKVRRSKPLTPRELRINKEHKVKMKKLNKIALVIMTFFITLPILAV